MFRRLALPLLLAAAFCCRSAAAETRSILVLHSYQDGQEWVERVNTGIRSVFTPQTGFETVFRYEYMNVLDADPADYPQVYRLRLSGQKFDLVLAVDNPALEFVVANRERFFRGVPVVFCSIDNWSPRLLAGQLGITGVSGEQDYESTLWLALRLHPRAQHMIVFVNRRLPAERAAYRQLQRLVREELAGLLDVHFWEDPRLPVLLAKARGMGQDTVVVVLSYFLDGEGRPLPLESSVKELAEALPAPMYSSWEALVGQGIVGGMISGGFQQGQSAGWLALRILKGENPDSIPVLHQGSNRYTFDYEELRRFGIPAKALPEGSLIVNRPVGFFERYRTVIWVSALVVALLAAALVLSWLYSLVQSRLQRLILESQQRLAAALEAAGGGIWEYEPQTGRTILDPSWFAMLGYEADELPQAYETWVGLLHPDERAACEREVRRHIEESTDFNLEFRMRARDGSWKWIDCRGTVVQRDEQGRVLRLVGTHLDITARKGSEEVIRESARRYLFLYEKSPCIRAACRT
jgi:PAS domain S-box-containing protein